MKTSFALTPLLAAMAAAPLPVGAQPVLAPQVLAEATALVKAAAAALAPPGARIEVVPGLLDPRLRLAPCERIEPHLAAGTPAWGRTRVGLRCRQGASAWQVSLPVQVQVHAPALVARAALPGGSVIETGHLAEAVIDWAAEPSPPHTRSESLVGRTLARPVSAGQPVRGADLRSRQWFAAGETVKVVAVGPGFAISGEGQALSNGIEGQPARVRTESGRIVSGRPVGERRVEVAL